MSPGENPVQVRILRGVQRSERVLRAREDALCNGAFHVLEKRRVATQMSHHKARKKQAKKQSPAPRVPTLRVEALALRLRPAAQQRINGLPAMHPRENSGAKQPEIIFEFSSTPNPERDRLR